MDYKSIDIPSIGTVDFPSTMSDDEITHAIKTKILPTQEPSLLDKVIGSAPGSLALGASDLVTGPLVFGANVGSKLMEKLDPETAKRFNLGEYANEKMAELNAASERGRKYHGNRDGFDAIRMLGGLGTGLAGTGKQILSLPAAQSYAGKALEGLGLGAVYGATSAPTTSTPQPVDQYLDEQATRTGAGGLIGLGMPAVVSPLAKGIYNLAAPHLAGGAEASASKAMLAAAGDRLKDIKRELLAGGTPEHLTASQAASRAGRAEWSALGEVGRRIDPSSYDDIAKGGIQANKGLIQKHIAGSEQDLADALAHRESVSRGLYGEAYKGEPIPIDKELSKILSRPSMKTAISNAQKLAGEQSKPFIIGGSPVAGSREPIVSKSGQILGSRGPKSEESVTPSKIPVESLHYIKKGLDDVLSKKIGEEGLAPNVKRAVGETKKDYLAWLRSKSEPYRAAAESHVEQSLPINQMNYGQYLGRKLRTPDEVGENAEAFLKARQNPSDSIETALGGPWYKKESEFLDPTQIGALDTISERLTRQAIDRDLASKGSSALRNIVSESLDSTGHIPNLLYRPVALAHYGIDRLRGIAGKQAVKEIAEAMKTPEGALRLLSSDAPQMQEIKKALMERMLTRTGAMAAPRLMGGN